MEYDIGQVTSRYVGVEHRDRSERERLGPEDDLSEGDPNKKPEVVKELFKEFLKLFRESDEIEYKYRESLRRNVHARNYFLEIAVQELGQYRNSLKTGLIQHPGYYLPLFEEAAREVAVELSSFAKAESHPIQIILVWDEPGVRIRDLLAETMSTLISLPGIVINTSKTSSKVIHATLQCRSCKGYHKMAVPANQQLQPPPQCVNSSQSGAEKCQNNPYQIIPAMCTYIDQQFIKLQELPEDVPTGELPRHITLHLDRYLCDRVQAGKRVTVVGIQSLAAGKAVAAGVGRRAAGLRRPFIRAVGIFLYHGPSAMGGNSTRHSARSQFWGPEDESLFIRLSRENNLYEKLARSIDPAIYGLEDVKKAIVCQLFGGTRKLLPDGTKLRGDMNVLLVGDPSTAKSQLLKYAHKVAPIGVYTSGKGSSAAGLTATVVRGQQNDFYLEGGALVLADGGIVCIDEFDKMGTDDQVAIHEAMEQQTISIAKAGITTVLNARASVLAAANPRFGVYDPLKSSEDQLDFQSTILTRFDLIFKILDPRDPQRDICLAKHVIAVHKSGNKINFQKRAAALPSRLQRPGVSGSVGTGPAQEFIPIAQLKSYIDYCKHKCFPILDESANKSLQDFYVQMKKKTTNLIGEGGSGGAKGTISVSVRQLEAIIRIAEALAKMHLRHQATREDVAEAIRLFRVSTMEAIASGLQDALPSEEIAQEILKVEAAIRRRLNVGMSAQYRQLVHEFEKQGFDRAIVDRAVAVMAKRDEVEWKQQQKFLTRKK